MNTTRGSLVIALSRLGLLYPSMRLGQLLEMLVTMAGAESVAEFEAVADDRLVQAATDHIAGRAAQLDQMVIQKAENSMERQQILASLARMVDDDPRLMRAFLRWADESGTSIYDIEDSVVLAKLGPHSVVA